MVTATKKTIVVLECTHILIDTSTLHNYSRIPHESVTQQKNPSLYCVHHAVVFFMHFANDRVKLLQIPEMLGMTLMVLKSAVAVGNGAYASGESIHRIKGHSNAVR